jgi:Fe-S oxidoreductase
MTSVSINFMKSLDDRVLSILENCTSCGACATVCPTPQLANISDTEPVNLVNGVLDILRSKEIKKNAKVWAESCCGSGFCQSACDYGINPRFMLAMARRSLNAAKPEKMRRDQGKNAFKKMSRGVRVLSRLQLHPKMLDKISPRSHPKSKSNSDVVFYTGCNMLKTPHIGLLCLDVLDRLDLTYEVHGGPSSCCGILQFRPGDTENAGRQALKTIDTLAKTNASKVLSWCPTCQIQFAEVASPSSKAAIDTNFNMTMFPVFLAGNLDRLRPLLKNPVKKRVAVHEYAGELGVMTAVRELLTAVPGIELIDLGHKSAGYTGTALAQMKEYQQKTIAKTLLKADEMKIDTLVGVYHNDHREFSGHEAAWNFKVANYMELIGESMGINRPDMFKQMKLMGDVDAILSSASELIEENGLDLSEVREVVISDMLNDQQLPVDRNLHQ